MNGDRQRQSRVELSHTLGKYQGKQVAQERRQRCLYRRVQKETADTAGVQRLPDMYLHSGTNLRQSESLKDFG